MTLEELFGLSGRVAVVTGASGAIGSELARGLAAAGARVALLARRPAPLEALARELEAAGAEAGAWAVDILDVDEVAAVRDEIVSRWGAVDLLLNVAGGN